MSLTLLKNLDIATSDESAPVSISPAFGSTEEPQVSMRVQKRNGSFEPVDVNKIVRAVARCSVRLTHVDPLKIATKTIGGLYDGATTKELDTLSIQTAAQLIAKRPSIRSWPPACSRLLSIRRSPIKTSIPFLNPSVRVSAPN